MVKHNIGIKDIAGMSCSYTRNS